MRGIHTGITGTKARRWSENAWHPDFYDEQDDADLEEADSKGDMCKLVEDDEEEDRQR